MSARDVVAQWADLDPAAIRVLLCDADGNLVPSEEPAFVASTEVTNRLLAELGSDRRWEPAALQRATLGRNFRSVAAGSAEELGAPLSAEDLERWVHEERRAVTEHLRTALHPDPDVTDALRRLAGDRTLAVVSSSALGRLDASFEAAGLAELLPAARRFSAEDSLPEPTSKPHPAVYLHALEQLGLAAHEALAVEDSVTGTSSAVAAGIPTVGNVLFVAREDREARTEDLRAAGALAVVSSWAGVEELLAPQPAGGS